MGRVLIGLPNKRLNLSIKSIKKRDDMPIINIACSKVRVKSNCEHGTTGPKVLSLAALQGTLTGAEGLGIAIERTDRPDQVERGIIGYLQVCVLHYLSICLLSRG